MNETKGILHDCRRYYLSATDDRSRMVQDPIGAYMEAHQVERAMAKIRAHVEACPLGPVSAVEEWLAKLAEMTGAEL